MMPKMRCSQRRTIISFAAAPPRKEQYGRHAGNEYRNRCRNMATPRNSGASFCGTTVTDCGANRQSGYARMFRETGARERTRTSTTLRSLAPEASASASSATRAQMRVHPDRVGVMLELLTRTQPRPHIHRSIFILPGSCPVVNATRARLLRTAAGAGTVATLSAVSGPLTLGVEGVLGQESALDSSFCPCSQPPLAPGSQAVAFMARHQS